MVFLVWDLMVIICDVEVVVLLEAKLFGSETTTEFEGEWISILLVTSAGWCIMAKLCGN